MQATTRNILLELRTCEAQACLNKILWSKSEISVPKLTSRRIFTRAPTECKISAWNLPPRHGGRIQIFVELSEGRIELSRVFHVEWSIWSMGSVRCPSVIDDRALSRVTKRQRTRVIGCTMCVPLCCTPWCINKFTSEKYSVFHENLNAISLKKEIFFL